MRRTSADRVVVTGGAGFIGSHLIERLAEDDSRQIMAVDNLTRGKRDNLLAFGDRIEFVNGDVRDRALMEHVLRGVHTVFHLAAQSNVIGAAADIDYSFTTNVLGTFEVLRASALAGVQCVVFASSREVYGDPAGLPVAETAPLSPKNHYGASKAAAESYCRAFNSADMQVRIVRLTNVYGPRDEDRVIPIFLRQALAHKPLTVFGGTQVLDFLWVKHAVEALIRVADTHQLCNPINVGSGRATKLIELAESIIRLTDSKSHVSLKPARHIEVHRFVADTTRCRHELGLMSPEDPLAHLPEMIHNNGLHKGSRDCQLVTPPQMHVLPPLTS